MNYQNLKKLFVNFFKCRKRTATAAANLMGEFRVEKWVKNK